MFIFGHTARMPCLSKIYPEEIISADKVDVTHQEIKNGGCNSL